jgi:hypothetical protein
VDLIFGYPAILLGLIVGLLAARMRWRLTPILILGAVVFAALVLRESTVPRQASPEGNGSFTPAIAALFVFVNAGCWALGVAMGVAAAQVMRRDRRV